MTSSLLVTKLNIPLSRPQLVARPRLTQRLQEGLGYNLILVSAPAGFGKTTAVSEWVHSLQGIRTAWLSLDEGDSDPVRFWSYFIAAIQTIHPGFGEKILPWLHSSQTPSMELLLTSLINELTSIEGDIVIVLDDYHLIKNQPIHEELSYLIEHLPTQVHLVIAARAAPPLPLARFRGRGIMFEIHTDDLRFSVNDAASLMRELKTPELSILDVTALNERTEGWAVGLKMAALSMTEQKDIPGFIAAFTGSQRYIMDYLMEEVIQVQSQELRDFLMKTSMLERLTAPLCDAITGQNDSQEKLLDLERRHLFIVPLDESRQWYRYEHLFADLLKHQCVTVYGTEQVAALHRQASQWYENNNLPDEAIHLALEAKDWPLAIRLINDHSETQKKRGEFNTVVSWLGAIPQEILCKNLHLYGQYACCLVNVGQMEAAEVVLSYLETATMDEVTQGEVALARGMVSRYRGDRRCIEHFEKAYALLPPDDVAMRGRVAVNIAHFQQRYNNFTEAERWAKIACELGQQAGDNWTVVSSLDQMGIVAAYRGKLRRAIEIFKKEIEFAKHRGVAYGSYGMLCWTQYSLNELEAVSENAKLALEQNPADIAALFNQSQVCLTRGDVAAAEALMKRLDRASLMSTVDSFWYATYIGFRVLHAIRQDKVEEATRWGEQFAEPAGMMLIVRHIPARLLVAQGRKEEAASLLQKLYDSAVKLGSTMMMMRIRIYQALAANTEELALDFLAEALAEAEPEGAIRYFADEGRLLKPVLEKALSRGITPGFTRKLLDIVDEEERLRQARRRESMSSTGLLSAREMDVLRLIIDGLSNQQIADNLNISLNTAKTHVYHIFDKLEAKDRLEAVTRAKELKLV